MVHALGSSGSTWASLVLSSHRDATYIGPPDRLWKLESADADAACLVHRDRCDFWPSFVRKWNRDGDFVDQLFRHCGTKQLVMFNPSPLFREEVLARTSARVREIVLLRDLRAVACSLMRHQPERYPSIEELIRRYLAHRLEDVLQKARESGVLCLRYEELVNDSLATLERVGEFTGLDYDASSLRFWECGHHMTVGNTGVIDLLRRMQGMDGFEHRRSDFYEEAKENLVKEPEKPVVDESWREELSAHDRLMLDAVYGELASGFGYERESFPVEQRDSVIRDLVLRDLPEFQSGNPLWTGKSRKEER